MKIIVLGMDNTGKSTLCEYLRDRQDFELVHSCGPHKTKEQMEKFMREVLSKEGYIVYERFPLFEEMVYGKILRNKSEFSFTDDIVDFVLEQDVEIVYCRPDTEVIKNWKDREQMNGVIEKADDLINKWDRVIRKARKRGFKIIKFDYTKHSFDDLLMKL